MNGEAPPHACSVSLTNGASKRMVSGITGRAVAGVGHTCGDEESEVQHIDCRAYRVRSVETQGLRQMAQLWTCEPRKQPGLLLLSVENVTAWELRCSKYRNQKKTKAKKQSVMRLRTGANGTTLLVEVQQASRRNIGSD